MDRHYLTFDGSKYYLRPDTDLDALASRLSTAVKDGGDVVQLEIAGRNTIRVIATSGIPIVIETDTDEDSDRDPSSEATWTIPDEIGLDL